MHDMADTSGSLNFFDFYKSKPVSINITFIIWTYENARVEIFCPYIRVIWRTLVLLGSINNNPSIN